MKLFPTLLSLLLLLSTSACLAQRPPGPPPRGGGQGGPGEGRPPSREHTATEAKEIDLVEANRRPPAKSEVEVTKDDDSVTIEANGIPDHKVARFPNKGNPHEITGQGYDIELPANPEPAPEITFLHSEPGQPAPRPMQFGITLDGVIIQPDTAEFWMGDREKNWNYEALGGAVGLGLDTNYAHVQPTGMYHYHGIPTGLMRRLGFTKGEHSPMIGWAADGFPIYAMFGYSDPTVAAGEAVELKTSYALKAGNRPANPEGPGGAYDGAFVQDYEYVPGSGDLDECNGRFCVTPEFPDGTYAYFMTSDWPVIPRAFKGTPETLVEKGAGGPGGNERPPRRDDDRRPPGDGPPPFSKGGKGGPPPR
ncbi:MAG: YHYH protein [Verrucomicrobiales bacterium]|nr:YHYH protein [Verrucomicrobiales bacterium]